jgi:dTDP-4-amino-4,6-dideoxygalactose transaminase
LPQFATNRPNPAAARRPSATARGGWRFGACAARPTLAAVAAPAAAPFARRLGRLAAENARRAELDARYRELLAGVAGLTPALAPVADALLAHHLFTVVLEESVDRAGFREALAKRGIQTSVHYPPAHRFSIYAGERQFPVTEDYGARAVTLPMFATMTSAQQDEVVDAIRAALEVVALTR